MHAQQKAIEFITSHNKHCEVTNSSIKFNVNFRRLRGGFTPVHIAVVINNVPALGILL
jgi:hypothetical protein